MPAMKRCVISKRAWILLPILLILFTSVNGSSSGHRIIQNVQSALSIRGGDEAGGSAVTGILGGIGKASLATIMALKRAIVAAFSLTDDDEENTSGVGKLFKTLGRMWNAAMDTEKDGNVDKEVDSSTKESPTMDDSEPMSDFGVYLAKSYGVTREESAPVMLAGTIGDALRDARSKARLLLVFIPAERPSGKKSTTPDYLAIQSLQSEGVMQMANKPSRKKSTTGSFVLWGAKASSPEAVTAMKRLKIQSEKRRPTLVVAYPAQVVDSSGQPKLVPRLLAQHHCCPPPSAESMAAWLNALRKRHAKQYASMQNDLKEMQLYKERQQGYRSSIQDDVKRKEQEQRDEEDRLAKEAAELARLETLSQRRVELIASLPEEPPKEVSFTVALRFANGTSGQRRFAPDTPLTMVFNWVDAMYEMERELVLLSTMNGQKVFTWDDASALTLEEAGLSKMTGLRVSLKDSGERLG